MQCTRPSQTINIHNASQGFAMRRLLCLGSLETLLLLNLAEVLIGERLFIQVKNVLERKDTRSKTFLAFKDSPANPLGRLAEIIPHKKSVLAFSYEYAVDVGLRGEVKSPPGIPQVRKALKDEAVMVPLLKVEPVLEGDRDLVLDPRVVFPQCDPGAVLVVNEGCSMTTMT